MPDTPLFDQLVAEQDAGLMRRIGVGIYLDRGFRELEAYLDVHATWAATEGWD